MHQGWQGWELPEKATWITPCKLSDDIKHIDRMAYIYYSPVLPMHNIIPIPIQ